MKILSIDYGEKRVGLALASEEVRIATPYKTLNNDENLLKRLADVVEEESVGQIVVGLPRDLNGKDTPQTTVSRRFASSLDKLGLPIALQDEALTSHKAKDELDNRGKPYHKEEIDALAATFILEDYLSKMDRR